MPTRTCAQNRTMHYLHDCAPLKRTLIEAHGLMSAHVYKSGAPIFQYGFGPSLDTYGSGTERYFKKPNSCACVGLSIR